MTKWFITFAGGAERRWQFVEFGGPSGSESRGIVDILAIRKDHRSELKGLKRGDCFEVILIQTKGGTSPRPSAEDVMRLARLARRYHAKAVVLAEWEKRARLQLYRLDRGAWCTISPREVFAAR